MLHSAKADEEIVYSPSKYRETEGIKDYDRYFFEGLFEDFVFPDGTEPIWESLSWLQKRFMKWFNNERLRKLLTFPVETLSLLDDGKEYKDKEWADFAAEMLSEGHSFFIYRSSSVDSLSSCCRLRNEIQDNQFTYTLGAGGVSTGSKCVITINANRLVQEFRKTHKTENVGIAFADITKRIHKYLKAFNTILDDRYKAGLIPIYDAGFVIPSRQYLTVGINGLIESAESEGLKIESHNKAYKEYIDNILTTIHKCNVEDREEGIMFNTEMVPAENLGVKHARWDREDGYFVPRDCYNSYFYKVEDTKTNLLDKFILHGDNFTRNLDGGSALHANLSEHLTKTQYTRMLEVAMMTGCSYFTFNIPNTLCKDCGFITKHRVFECPVCDSKNIAHATRVIGYLKLVPAFSEARQKEESLRYYE